MQNSEDFSSASKPASPSFDDAIAPLEDAAGDFLTGPGRTRMEAAFASDPEAFARLVRKALTKRSARSLLGLFVRIVDDELVFVSRKLAAERERAEVERSRYEARYEDLSERAPSGEAPAYHHGAEEWVRKIGVRMDDDILVRAVLEDQVHVGPRGVEQLLELWRELRGEKAA